MSIIRMPANLILPGSTTRRNVLRGAAGLGLGLGAASAFGNLAAQDHPHATPPAGGDSGGGVISSDTSTETTGAATPGSGVEEVPFERYNPYLDPVEPGDKEVGIAVQDRIVEIKTDVKYAAWTFNGRVPGPTIRAVQGDKIHVRVVNEAAMTHSVDFHSAEVMPEKGYKNVQPGEIFEWEYTANYPGAFMVHCGTAPVLMHIAAGMYLPMIVDPAENMFQPATEVILSQSEFYVMDNGDGTYVTDGDALFNQAMSHIMAFNGHASQYVTDPIRVPAGELVRIYFVNMGPNVWSSFHIVGGIFSHAYFNANPNNALEGLQALTVGPGDGACFEITFPEPGRYIAVNHAFGHAQHGAMAFFEAE